MGVFQLRQACLCRACRIKLISAAGVRNRTAKPSPAGRRNILTNFAYNSLVGAAKTAMGGTHASLPQGPQRHAMDGIRGAALCVLASGRGAVCSRGRQDLRGYRAGRLRGFAGRSQDAQVGHRSAGRQADLGHARGGAARLEGCPRALHADGGLPLRQQDRRRVGRQGQRLAARRRPDRLCRQELRHLVRQQSLVHRQCDRQSPPRRRRAAGSMRAASPRSCCRSCRRPRRSKPTWRPDITRSSFCCGART